MSQKYLYLLCAVVVFYAGLAVGSRISRNTSKQPTEYVPETINVYLSTDDGGKHGYQYTRVRLVDSSKYKDIPIRVSDDPLNKEVVLLTGNLSNPNVYVSPK